MVRGRKKIGLILGAAVATAAVIALLAAAAGGWFASPRQKLERAVIKSLAAYARAGDALDLPELDRLAEERSVSQRMSFRLTGMNTDMVGYDLSALEGLGLRFQSDLEARKLGIELAAFWDDRELLTLFLAADDAEVCLASPQLTGEDFYGVNTETLGEDLRRIGFQDMGDVSFNFFDLLDIIAPERQAEEIEQAVKEAGKALFEAARVEKDGKETIFVNRTKIKTDVYRMTVPEEAIKDYVNAVAGAIRWVDYVKLCREARHAMGASGDVLEEALGPYGDPGDLLDGLGDVKLTVHVGGGYVSAVAYEGYIFGGGAPLKLELYLGGGGEYVDNLGLEVETDGRNIVIDSAGDHGCKNGYFTDETTVRGPFFAVASKFRYEPGQTQKNLFWEISVPGTGSLEMAGQLTGGDGSVDLHLDELYLKVLGLELCSMEMDYYVGPCEGQSVTVRDPRMIGEMDGLELMLAALRLENGVQAWVEDMRGLFISRLPSGLPGALPDAF